MYSELMSIRNLLTVLQTTIVKSTRHFIEPNLTCIQLCTSLIISSNTSQFTTCTRLDVLIDSAHVGHTVPRSAIIMTSPQIIQDSKHGSDQL